MKKILVFSVGGSAEPIINAIKNYNPDFVYFFCSSGPKGSAGIIDSPGDPCGDKRKSRCTQCGHEYYLGNPRGKAIVFQTGLKKGQYEIEQYRSVLRLSASCWIRGSMLVSFPYMADLKAS